MKNIFVGNLDFNASEEGVRSLFEQHGQVNSARIMTDRETGRSRGFAFVEMENEGEADQAIAALNGYTLDGRALNVNEARPKPDRGSGASMSTTLDQVVAQHIGQSTTLPSLELASETTQQAAACSSSA